jgi:hypothetical protein
VAAEAIVEPHESGQAALPKPSEESTQRAGVGITTQSRQILERAVVLQQPRGLDPSQAQGDRIEDRQQFFADGVSGVPTTEPNRLHQQTRQAQLTHKTLQQVQAAEVRQGHSVKRNPNALGQFSHDNHRPPPVVYGCKPRSCEADSILLLFSQIASD